MNDINRFTFFRNYYDSIKDIDVDEKKEILLAIVEYVFDNKEPQFSGLKKTVWLLMMPYLSTSKNRSNNAKLKVNQNKIKSKSKANQTSSISTSISTSNSNNNIFSKPSIEDITKYCRERSNKVNPQKFYDFYESKGWMVGRNKMKDWKASVRTWEKEDENTPDWFDKDIKEDKASPKEQAKMEEMINKFKEE
jgi:hypothetical protein